MSIPKPRRLRNTRYSSARALSAATGLGPCHPQVSDFSANQMLHWNGNKWSTATVPDPGGTSSEDSNCLEDDTCGSARLRAGRGVRARCRRSGGRGPRPSGTRKCSATAVPLPFIMTSCRTSSVPSFTSVPISQTDRVVPPAARQSRQPTQRTETARCVALGGRGRIGRSLAASTDPPHRNPTSPGRHQDPHKIPTD